MPYRRIIDDWRKEALGLGEGPRFPMLGGYAGGMATRLCMVSPSVIPRPDDWDDGVHMTGYWFLDEGRDWRPDPKLQAFLDAGEPPVYIGFGSMTTKNPAQVTEAALGALRRSGLRAILATGWGGMSAAEAPDGVHLIKSAPHDALFRQVQAVVHHGGAGSTAAGLRAGLPTLVCPLTVDQPFWGQRVRALGCGPEPQSLRRLDPERLAAGLDDLVTEPRYREQADAIAAAIAGEDGLSRAVEWIETA
jgi:sterol 3beta-glucosyltransferase